jgi:hypothetical protein
VRARGRETKASGRRREYIESERERVRERERERERGRGRGWMLRGGSILEAPRRSELRSRPAKPPAATKTKRKNKEEAEMWRERWGRERRASESE